MLRLVLKLALVASAIAYSLAPATSAPQALARSAPPRAQFGTGNYDSRETTGFFLSPVPGEAKGYQSPKTVDLSGAGFVKIVVAFMALGIPALFIAGIIFTS